MSNIKRLIITWASVRVTYLGRLQKYEDSYAVSQEFYEWTSALNVHPDICNDETLKVPDFNNENRTL